MVCQSKPDVIAHNLETVESLQSLIRPQCRYSWSLETLRIASRNNIITKSNLMLGFGEKKKDVVETMRHLVEANCQILSIGQYLRPSKKHLEVVEYVHPDKFLEYKVIGESLGINACRSGAFGTKFLSGRSTIKKSYEELTMFVRNVVRFLIFMRKVCCENF